CKTFPIRFIELKEEKMKRPSQRVVLFFLLIDCFINILQSVTCEVSCGRNLRLEERVKILCLMDKNS
ncbi:hypothetical protein, partial [Porphyromonas macacae]|uniref:hypothetical protein n=1 Tax=Porphyromonas macacae TaxID=28115 RepID=UPI00055F827A